MAYTSFFLITSLVFLNPLKATSQELNNFDIRKGEIVWQKSFPTTMSLHELSKKIRQSGLFETVDVVDSSFSGHTVGIVPEHKAAGYTGVQTPAYLLQAKVRSFAVIEYRGDAYDVVLKQLNVVNLANIKAGALSQRSGDETPLETHAADNTRTRFRNNFRAASDILNYTFAKKFTFQ